MAPRQRNGKRSFKVVVVTQEQRATAAKIEKIKSVLGIETQEQFTDAAIKILSLAAGFAELHGFQHVVLGVKRNMVRVFSDPDK